MQSDKKSMYRKYLSSSSVGNEGGFTLLEIIMAISILTIGLLAVASMQMTAIRGNSVSRDLTIGTDMIQDRIEKIFSLSFANNLLVDTDFDGLGGLNDTGAAADQSDETDVKYNVYWNIADNQPISNVKTIRIIVQWLDRGIQKQHEFDFLRTEV